MRQVTDSGRESGSHFHVRVSWNNSINFESQTLKPLMVTQENILISTYVKIKIIETTLKRVITTARFNFP